MNRKKSAGKNAYLAQSYIHGKFHPNRMAHARDRLFGMPFSKLNTGLLGRGPRDPTHGPQIKLLASPRHPEWLRDVGDSVRKVESLATARQRTMGRCTGKWGVDVNKRALTNIVGENR